MNEYYKHTTSEGTAYAQIIKQQKNGRYQAYVLPEYRRSRIKKESISINFDYGNGWQNITIDEMPKKWSEYIKQYEDRKRWERL